MDDQQERVRPSPPATAVPDGKQQPSVEVFVRGLTACGLMTDAEVQAFLETLPAEKRPADARQFAQELYRQGKLTKFQVQAVYQGKARGLVLGNYVILGKLGAGGMGEVYQARHRKMDRVVALKLLRWGAAQSADAVKRFEREAQAAAKLAHPNIVTAHDFDESQGMHFMVMEHVDGCDLGALVAHSGPLAVCVAVDCIVQAARGLQYAHEHGVIHRDVKPSNLMLTGIADRRAPGPAACPLAASGHYVKILDMGLARIDEAVGAPLPREGLTQTGQVLGTLDFMAPEQAVDTRHADARSDIYSLGCTLYYLLTGRPPYGGDTLGKKLVAHREMPIPALCSLRPDVPERLDGVFRTMLAKDPQGRPASMGRVIAELQACELPRTPAPAGLRGAMPAMSETHSFQLDHARDTTDMPRSASPPPPSAASTPRADRPAGQPAPPPPKRPAILIVAVTLALAGAIVWGIAISMRTADGTLVVELSEPNATVQILSSEGKVIVQQPAAQDRLTLSVVAGQHRLRVEKNGVELYARDFTIASGGREVIKARWEPAKKPGVAPRVAGGTSRARDRSLRPAPYHPSAVPPPPPAPVPRPVPGGVILLAEDWDRFPVGEFPAGSGWLLAKRAEREIFPNNHIVDSTRPGGGKCLMVSNPSNGSGMEVRRQLDWDPTAAATLRIEFRWMYPPDASHGEGNNVSFLLSGPDEKSILCVQMGTRAEFPGTKLGIWTSRDRETVGVADVIDYGQWVSMRIEIDLAGHTYDVWFNDRQLGHGFPTRSHTYNPLILDCCKGFRQAGPGFYDDIVVTALRH